jgi:hypothetical protein
MASIQDFWLKIKEWAGDVVHEWGLVGIVLLLGISAFGLGRLSALEGARPLVSVGEASTLTAPRSMYLGGRFVASRSGSTYYYPWCAGAAKIAPGNEVWFASEDAAQAAGYAPAKNCKGLQ